MIVFDKNVFRLATKETSYIFRVTSFGHLEHAYYGNRIPDDQDIEPFLLKHSALLGSSVVYDEVDPLYCLDNVCLEWSGIGKGDYRESPLEMTMPDNSYTADFVFDSHEIVPGSVEMKTLPSAYGDVEECTTLKIVLCDKSNQVYLDLYYSVYESVDVISRRVVLRNQNEKSLTIHKIMSMSLDMPGEGYDLFTLDGAWIKETHLHKQEIGYGIHVNSSTTGASSNRHNPGFMVAEKDATQDFGRVFGFNLVYSGNHYSAVELSTHSILRVVLGINPYCFAWELSKGEEFEAPEAVFSYSKEGFNGLSAHMHDFVNFHIVRGDWKGKERPILLNNWEAHFFDFNQDKLLKLAKRAKKVGVEMFVLDDGWFGKRDSDFSSLGDYSVNQKKLPGGLKSFSNQIHAMGMQFGLWFEPEMINEDSELYRAHPEYALTTPGKKAALGRNQLVLDLCNEEVRDYIVKQVSTTLDEGGVDYVKWDYNRHISDAFSPQIKNQGEFFHRTIMGLYDVLSRIFKERPYILFESCSSGGNRFDLGMLCFSPQIWSSDNTDPIERLKIQEGLSYLYPLSTMGAHVSEAPHQQTLRNTPIPTRFNVAAFGCLGYELDLKYLNKVERKEVQQEIEFYKKYRSVFQYGRFFRGQTPKDNKVVWHCVSKDQKVGVTGFFQTLATASESADKLELKNLKGNSIYRVKTRPQSIFIQRFGGLVKHLLPITLDPRGFVIRTANSYYSMVDCVECYKGYGKALEEGIMLNNQFVGSYYNENTRLLGDFGSNLYIIEEMSEKTAES